MGKHRKPPRRPTLRTVAMITAGLLVPSLGGAVAVAATHDPGRLTARFVKYTDWSSGFQGAYVVHNDTQRPVSGWRLRFDLAAGDALTSVSDGKLSGPSGPHWTIVNSRWNRMIKPGHSVTVGLVGQYDGDFTAPTACLINGQACGATPEKPAASHLVARGRASQQPTHPPDSASDPSTASDPTPSASPSASAAPSASTTTSPSPSASPSTGPTTAEPPPPPDPDTPFAPYVDATQWPPVDLVKLADAGHAKHFTLGFVASGTGCTPAWGGATPVRKGPLHKKIKKLRTKSDGGVVLSFGGPDDTDLAQSCHDVRKLTDAYRTVIDTYDVTDIEFSLDDEALTDPQSIERRSKALARLQADSDAAPHISFSLPVQAAGLTDEGLGALRSATVNGVDINLVNLRTGDYAGTPHAPLGTQAVRVAEHAHAQLRTVFPHDSAAQRWQRIGVTPTIGRHASGETFTLDDTDTLLDWAKDRNIGRISPWAATRDVACDDDSAGHDTQRCTGVDEKDHAFTKKLSDFPS